jgi:hypothetical protein
MADLRTARAAARLITAHLHGDDDSRAAELTTSDPAALADAAAQIAAHILAELTPGDQPGVTPYALITALRDFGTSETPGPDQWAVYAACLFEGG